MAKDWRRKDILKGLFGGIGLNVILWVGLWAGAFGDHKYPYTEIAPEVHPGYEPTPAVVIVEASPALKWQKSPSGLKWAMAILGLATIPGCIWFSLDLQEGKTKVSSPKRNTWKGVLASFGPICLGFVLWWAAGYWPAIKPDTRKITAQEWQAVKSDQKALKAIFDAPSKPIP